jgi:uncharacterized Zn finger protein (UPF0148 family)
MAAFHACPKGHQSSEPDFCSECGAKIQGARGAATSNNNPSFAAKCPDCGAPVPTDGSVFCEVCGYNFRTRAHGQIAMTTEPAPPPPPSTPAQQSEPVASQAPIELTVTVDPSLREPDSPEPPASSSPQTIAVDKPVALIGRRSETRAIYPEIALDFDTAVSHRHAILSRAADGSITLRDIGSANGTRLNDRDLPPMTDVAVHDGDQVTLGHWTRIVVKAKS